MPASSKRIECPALPEEEEDRCSHPGCPHPENGMSLPPVCDEHEHEAAAAFARRQ